nr:hypothetical protein [Clostridium perfringens]
MIPFELVTPFPLKETTCPFSSYVYLATVFPPASFTENLAPCKSLELISESTFVIPNPKV